MRDRKEGGYEERKRKGGEGREGGYVVNAPLSDAPGARWNMRHVGLLARLPLYYVMDS